MINVNVIAYAKSLLVLNHSSEVLSSATKRPLIETGASYVHLKQFVALALVAYVATGNRFQSWRPATVNRPTEYSAVCWYARDTEVTGWGQS